MRQANSQIWPFIRRLVSYNLLIHSFCCNRHEASVLKLSGGTSNCRAAAWRTPPHWRQPVQPLRPRGIPPRGARPPRRRRRAAFLARGRWGRPGFAERPGLAAAAAAAGVRDGADQRRVLHGGAGIPSRPFRPRRRWLFAPVPK